MLSGVKKVKQIWFYRSYGLCNNFADMSHSTFRPSVAVRGRGMSIKVIFVKLKLDGLLQNGNSSICYRCIKKSGISFNIFSSVKLLLADIPC